MRGETAFDKLGVRGGSSPSHSLASSSKTPGMPTSLSSPISDAPSSKECFSNSSLPVSKTPTTENVGSSSVSPENCDVLTPPSTAKSTGTTKYNLASTMQAINTIKSSPKNNPFRNKGTNDIHSLLLSESALMDKETNRIYWQGGSGAGSGLGRGHIISGSLTKPYITRKLQQRGLLHMKATVLSVILWVWIWGKVSRRFTSSLEKRKNDGLEYFFAMPMFLASLARDPPPFLKKILYLLRPLVIVLRPIIDFILLLLKSMLYIRLPPYSPRLLVSTIVLYLLESYNCSTRRYLSHAMNAPTEVQNYLEGLRNMKPVVKWKVRCFHYEEREILKGMLGVFGQMNLFLDKRLNKYDGTDKHDTGKSESEGKSSGGFGWIKPSSSSSSNSSTSKSNGKISSASSRDTFVDSPPSWMARKVITHEAMGTYKFGSCEDYTIATLWKRSQTFPPENTEAPFSKLALSKLLVLKDKKAREDYFAQQAAFVTMEGRKDIYAEFATNIEVEGFRSKLLAVRPVRHAPTSAALFRLHIYFLFTLLGLNLPFRIWFARHCDEIRVTVVKETSSSQDSMEEDDAMGVDGKSSWFRGRWGWGASSTSAAALERKRAQELFRQSMQSFSLYEEEPSSLDRNIAIPVKGIDGQSVTFKDAGNTDADVDSGAVGGENNEMYQNIQKNNDEEVADNNTGENEHLHSFESIQINENIPVAKGVSEEGEQRDAGNDNPLNPPPPKQPTPPPTSPQA